MVTAGAGGVVLLLPLWKWALWAGATSTAQSRGLARGSRCAQCWGTGRTGAFPGWESSSEVSNCHSSPRPHQPLCVSVLPGRSVASLPPCQGQAGLWQSPCWDHPGLKRVGASEAGLLLLGAAHTGWGAMMTFR